MKPENMKVLRTTIVAFAFLVLSPILICVAQEVQHPTPPVVAVLLSLSHSDFLIGRPEEEPLHKRAYLALDVLRQQLEAVSEKENLKVNLVSEFAGDKNERSATWPDVMVTVVLTRSTRTKNLACVVDINYSYGILNHTEYDKYTTILNKLCYGTPPAGWGRGFPTFREVMKAVELRRNSF